MALTQAVRSRQGEVEAMAERMGREAAVKAFGEQGPGLDVTLADLEGFFDSFVKGFARGAYAEAVERQAEQVPERAECPECGSECTRQKPPRARPMQTVHGPFQWEEPRHFCPRCARLFFPPATGVAD
jgi:Zn finger protein HypA/HybF involved in hydrogenase expression